MHTLRKGLGILFFSASLLSLNAQARDIGIAISEAPELSSGICFGESSIQTLNCAREKCAEAPDARLSDCLRILWCYPIGWTADIFMQSSEIHWHDYTCGWSSREKLEQAVKIKCDVDFLIECLAVQIWTPQGEKVNARETSTQTPAKSESQKN